ncbi:MAG: trypsin-like peptidase domain-containing protein [Sinomicrobium sp.]|nr:trypsin-like peptidase domain-containing protein [Sinomicrobium sp.]
MKKYLSLVFVSILGGILTLGTYIAFFNQEPYVIDPQPAQPGFIPASFANNTAVPAENVDFTVAAEKTVNSVVHVKNLTVNREPLSLFGFIYGNSGRERLQIGTGSGVIISPDGYIVTNNHVVENSKELQITLNNNKSYEAELIGTDPATDIALLKVDAKEPLPYLVFGDSDNTKVGEWVLAVGNPFNLTSTVTAGIISAKARDLNELDGRSQSFIQTDAAVNPGNSGGALVNTRGELIGINTAITSQTGSYVGYAFAVPSNNARKVVEDIMEYGNVQKGILGVTGTGLNSYTAKEHGIDDTEGFYVDAVEEDSGAEKAGIKEGDIIKKIDNVKITKFADLSGYLGSKRPNDMVSVTINRNGNVKTVPVKLIKTSVYEVSGLGIEVKNLTKKDMNTYNVKDGVKITRTSPYMSQYGLEGKLLVGINDNKVKTIDDVKYIMNNELNQGKKISLDMLNENGEKERIIFQ